MAVNYLPPHKSNGPTVEGAAHFTFPVAILLQLKSEVDELKKQWLELPALIKEKERKYEAALMFAPPDFDPDAAMELATPQLVEGAAPLPGKNEADQSPIEEVRPDAEPEEFTLRPPVEKHSEKATWIGSLRNTLTLSGRGMSHQELLAFVRANYPALPVSNGEKGFYNAVAKLADRKELVKRGGLLYASSVIDAMKARGEALPEVPEHQHRKGGSGEIVMQVLKEHPNGLTGPELRKAVAAIPHAPKSLREHGQYIYNILATLMGTGVVVKNGTTYQLAAEEL